MDPQWAKVQAWVYLGIQQNLEKHLATKQRPKDDQTINRSIDNKWMTSFGKTSLWEGWYGKSKCITVTILGNRALAINKTFGNYFWTLGM